MKLLFQIKLVEMQQVFALISLKVNTDTAVRISLLNFCLKRSKRNAQMPEFANKYPDMKLIIEHIGSIERIDAIAKATNGNIYTDTSGSAK